ncbi:hypothetical protein HY464_01210 [Candidatus Peregrinibacteria bacterium]|nr:hypothetical protein [Candidatus Peregrinibacteria bacterium]
MSAIPLPRIVDTGIRPLLREAGLEDKEIEIYLALLALKVARVSVIAKAARQTRSHTYLLLRALMVKGLVSEVEREKVLQFIAESPQRLLAYLTDRAEEMHRVKGLLEGVMPTLAALTSPFPGKPRVTLLQGVEGMKQLYRDVLQQEFRIFFNAEKMYEIFNSNLLFTLFGKDVHLRGRELFIDNAGARRYLREVAQHKEYEIRLLPKEMQFDTEAVIFGESVALFAYDDEQTIVRIENASITQAFCAWFDALWKVGKKT